MAKLLFKVCLLTFFLLPDICFSQISASETAGCAPLTNVVFTGVTGADPNSVLWKFGTCGTCGTSNLNIATHTFADPGTYQVSYTATVGGVPVSHALTIEVYGKPTPAFTATSITTGCVPLPVGFQSTSTGGGGSPIVEHRWVFGDGGFNTANTQSPTHIFTVAGTFNVTLIVTDQNGCDSALVIPQMVKADPKPKAIINTSPDPPAKCTPPMNVAFSGGSSQSFASNPVLFYQWSFASTLPNPPIQTYTSAGTFSEQLIVTDINGCSDTAHKNVLLIHPIAFFTIDDTVCYRSKRKDTIPFLDTTFFDWTGSVGEVFTWDYGDGTQDSLGYHIYQAPGDYLVTLTVKVGPCIDTYYKSIFVQEVIADFHTVPPYSCSLPLTMEYTNTSIYGHTYLWMFYNGLIEYGNVPGSSTDVNPSVQAVFGHVNQHTVFDFTTTTFTWMEATSRQGCWDTIEKPWMDTVYISTARPQPDVVEGCAPLFVTFSDSSRSREPIVEMWWDFGDGSPVAHLIAPSIGHTYNDPGIYYVTQYIKNSSGCEDTSYTVEIRVGTAPQADFTVSPTSACKGDPIQVTDNSSPSSTPIDTWYWYSAPDNNLSGCFNSPSISFPFSNTVGQHDLSLVVCSRGCCDSITKPAAITINGPIAQFRVEMDCKTPFDYNFIGNIQGADYWTWDFGDGTILNNSTNATVGHSYLATGNYQATLVAFNNSSGCPPDTFRRMIFVRDIQSVITANAMQACSDQEITFDGTSSQDHNIYGKNGYIWFWGDGTAPFITNLGSVKHKFPQAGRFDVRLIVSDTNSCRDTSLFQVYISELEAKFYAPPVICVPGMVNFVDISTSDTTITSWNWDFGNGSSSNLQHPSHQYSQLLADSFLVTLITGNSAGCSDTMKMTLKVSKPVAGFMPQGKTNLCLGDSLLFKPTVASHASYLWNFGDNNTSTAMQPWHTYPDSGTYSVTLTVTDIYGCQKSSTLFEAARVQRYPVAGFWASSDTMAALCYPLAITFFDTSSVSYLAGPTANPPGYQWNLGTGGSIVSADTVGKEFLAPGIYNIELIVSTSFGCSDTASKSIHIKGPLADLTFSSTEICRGDNIVYELINMVDVDSIHWNFGDGNSAMNSNPISHQYNFHPPNNFFNLVVVFYGGGCDQTKSQIITMPKVIADFNRNNETSILDSVHCLGTGDLFYNKSSNAQDYQWDFGDGNSSAQINPTHLYAQPGTYIVSLYIKSALGCVDSIAKTMVIHPVPTAVAAGGDTCLGSTLQLNASGGTAYLWSPPTGLNSATSQNPFATVSESTTYMVRVNNQFGCADSTFAHVNIIHPPPYIKWDTTIVIGQQAFMNYFISPPENYNIVWSPSGSLSCNTCLNPSTSPLENIQYILSVSDKTGCFETNSVYTINVLPVSSIDVPSAFTPNGDNTNDKVYVRGWGIKRLLEFNIYNRWGELVFSTDNIEEGWDGTYKGVLQNTETYAYTVMVETFVDERPLVKKGYIKLLR